MPYRISRRAYAETYGRPNLPEIIPSTTVDEFDIDDPNALQGNITVTNPGLKPWSADNFDLSLEKSSGSSWSSVASSTGTTSTESIAYAGAAGTLADALRAETASTSSGTAASVSHIR